MLSELCVRRPVFATMLVMSLVVLGIFSFRDLGVDLFPKADPATVNVPLPLPGASPDEMSSSVDRADGGGAQRHLRHRRDVRRASPRAAANITVRFVLERDLNDAANDVREKVAGAMQERAAASCCRRSSPKVDPDADPVMSLMRLVRRDEPAHADRDRRQADEARASRSVDGVGAGHASAAAAPREIHIVVDIEKLNSYGLSIDQVRDAIVRRRTSRFPAARSSRASGQLLLRTLGPHRRHRASSTTSSSRPMNGTPIRISDIGYAEDTLRAADHRRCGWTASPAVQLDIRRAIGREHHRGHRRRQARSSQTIQQALPQGGDADRRSRDDSRFIYASVASLEEHLLWGSLLAALVVMFFIRNIRAVIISALAIPASIIATFTLMRAMDFTLNNMTLLGITLAVGIVIDDAIVVLENIFRYIEEKDCTPFEAAIQGTREVALRGDGDDAVAGRDLPAGRVHDRLRAAVHLPVRLDDGVRDPGVDARQLHADADAQLAVPEAGRRRSATSKTKEQRLLPLARRRGTRVAELGARPPEADHRASRSCVFALTFPLNRMVGRDVRAQRGHGRVDDPPRHAEGHVARRHDGDRVQAA